ncbi:hypothetical protein [Enterobacter ludwigii]|uniref:hypothetical protein n=1 Tax=Enterobacter ludwigii TaxID=299767 RepID=UPI00307664AB
MGHPGKLIAVLMVAVALSGCQGFKNPKRVTVTPVTGRPVLASVTTAHRVDAPSSGAPGDAGVQKQLTTCLFEAEQLARLNAVKYREPVNDLYRNIRAAKYYATLAARMNTGSTDTLTPMYQFRVNDACNTVSQLLLGELKQGSTGPEGNR